MYYIWLLGVSPYSKIVLRSFYTVLRCIAIYRNFQRVVRAWIGWQRSHHGHMLLTGQKRCFYKDHLLTWAHIFILTKNISNIHGCIKRGHISLPDNVARMKINWKITKKLHVLLKITAKMCIMLRRLTLVLPTSSPIPCVLGCWLTSYFG